MAKCYKKDFKEEALRRSDEFGVKHTAAQMKIPYSTLSGWSATRKALESQASVGIGNRRLSTEEKEGKIMTLKKENCELKRANENLKDTLIFIAEHRK